jgi:hypothetical protein
MAIAAAKLSREYALPLAGSSLLATAQEFEAVIWIQDGDCQGMCQVKYCPRKSS